MFRLQTCGHARYHVHVLKSNFIAISLKIIHLSTVKCQNEKYYHFQLSFIIALKMPGILQLILSGINVFYQSKGENIHMTPLEQKLKRTSEIVSSYYYSY